MNRPAHLLDRTIRSTFAESVVVYLPTAHPRSEHGEWQVQATETLEATCATEPTVSDIDLALEGARPAASRKFYFSNEVADRIDAGLLIDEVIVVHDDVEWRIDAIGERRRAFATFTAQRVDPQ